MRFFSRDIYRVLYTVRVEVKKEKPLNDKVTLLLRVVGTTL